VRVRVEHVGQPNGDARDENRKVADAVDRERVLTPAPDEGANFTLVPFAESRNSESRESSDASPRGLPTSGVDVKLGRPLKLALSRRHRAHLTWLGLASPTPKTGNRN